MRDLLSRVPSDDVDLATDMTPEEVMDRFGDRAIPTGIRFGTVTVMASGQPFEVTTLRSERGYGDGRRPTEVEWGTQIEEDLARRDLTINAMAIDVSTGKLIDPYGGMEDLVRIEDYVRWGIRGNGSLRTGSGSCVPTDSWTLAHTEWSQTRACGMPSPHMRTCSIGSPRSESGRNSDASSQESTQAGPYIECRWMEPWVMCRWNASWTWTRSCTSEMGLRMRSFD